MPILVAKAIQRLPVAGGAVVGATVECLVQEAGHLELRNWHRRIHDPYIRPDSGRLDQHWNWPSYYAASLLLNESVGRMTEAFQLVVANAAGKGVPVGQALLVSGYPHPGFPRSSSTFVWFLTSAPVAALRALEVADRFVVMPLLLDTAVQCSRHRGLRGRIALHADNGGKQRQQEDLVRKYLACGMTPCASLSGYRLSLFRKMDARYFVHTTLSAARSTLRWNYLR